MRKDSKRTKKIRNLVLVCILSAVLLTVSTYAWFIGMQTVKVNSFDIEIASVDGLMLSMDGIKWDTTIYPTDTSRTPVYENNTNQFLDGENEGLIPMSSVGAMNTSSRMKLFQKGSLTTTKGGYRLMASEVANTTQLEVDETPIAGQYVEGKGYVAFDVFVMNLSGEAYYSSNNTANEEAIYLTYDSSVTSTENGTATTGIENSVRVGFAQIGRVNAKTYGNLTADKTEELATLTGLTCEDVTDEDDNVIATGICRNASIWEPNEDKHVEGAVNWYKKSCLKRDTAATTQFKYLTSSNTCTDIEEKDADGSNKHFSTYAVKETIIETDYVDVYDGVLNGYTPTKLSAVDTFTDTEKLVTGANRQELLTLAPNSITKVRVYIWLEGQDVDNYDFASLGNKISVAFGFTKERYTTEEIDENITVEDEDINNESLPEAE